MTDFLASIGRYVEARVNINDLGNALTLMGQGMVGIFVVMAIISLVVFLITKIPSKK
ncbi:MAG: hypothetical protein J6R66_01675 [Clostridia bacterium]|nr:hypothetical protein [Clostridia bacterium]